jgi:hypothetical protein
MTNGDRGSDLFNEILRAIAQEYGWPDYRPIEKTTVVIDPVEYQAYVGEYETDGLPRTTVIADAGALYMLTAALGPEPIRLHPSDKDRFFMLERNIAFTFTRDDKGSANGFEAEADGQRITARKTDLRN